MVRRIFASEATRGSAVRTPERRRTTASVTSETVSIPPRRKTQTSSRSVARPAETSAAVRLEQASSNRRITIADQSSRTGEAKEGSRI